MNLQQCVDLTFTVRPSWIEGKGVLTNKINSNHFLRILGSDTDISTIKPSTFTKLALALQEEGKAAGTVNRILAALHTCLHEAHLEGELESVPSYRRLKEPPARREWYTKEEVQTLLAEALKLPRDGLLMHRTILFLYLSGARRGELLKLKWSDVDLEGEQMTFTDTKNGEHHTITIHSQLLPVIKEMHHYRTGDDELVFGWGSRDSLNRRFKTLQRMTGLGSNRGLHQIRHTCATHLVEAGVPIRSIQGLLNHKNIETTTKYAKVNDVAKANAIANLSL
jgi:integrase